VDNTLIRRGSETLPRVTGRAGTIEPGLLPVFRFFTALHLVTVIVAVGVEAVLRLGSHVDLSDYLTIAWLALLLGYLSWQPLQARLGRAYLPIALIASSILPLVARALSLSPAQLVEVGDRAIPLAAAGSWRLFVALLIPLLLIGWQYSLKMVLAYIVTTTAIDVGLMALVWGNDPIMVTIGGITFSRTIIFLFTGYVVTRLMAAQRAQRAELAEANARLVHHAETVEQLAVSHERNRLARELHDTLAHTLSALAVQLEAVDSAWDCAPEQARAMLVKAMAGTRSGLTETRRALQSLRAAPLEDLGLALAVRNLAETTAARGGMTVEVAVAEEVEGLSPEAEQAIYRIAQEAMANTLRHAQAHRLHVALSRVNGHVRLDVRDDGQGFDPAQAQDGDHFGLRGMQERADLVHGSLVVTSRPGDGTQVRFEVG
jgi:signal transduction histidine kinase